MRHGMGEITVKLISTDRPQDGESWDEVKKLACYVLRGLSVHDDYRKEMSCAHENGRYLTFFSFSRQLQSSLYLVLAF